MYPTSTLQIKATSLAFNSRASTSGMERKSRERYIHTTTWRGFVRLAILTAFLCLGLERFFERKRVREEKIVFFIGPFSDSRPIRIGTLEAEEEERRRRGRRRVYRLGSWMELVFNTAGGKKRFACEWNIFWNWVAKWVFGRKIKFISPMLQFETFWLNKRAKALYLFIE